MAERSDLSGFTLQTVEHFRSKAWLVGWLAGNGVYWWLSAGPRQFVILNACCLLLLILQRRWKDEEPLDGNSPARRGLIIFSIHLVVACDVVSVLVDLASPTSLY